MAAHTGCSSFVEEKATACHSEPFAVILIPQSREKDLALPAQGKLREESPHLKAQSVRKNAGILRGVYPERSERAQNDRQWGYALRMTDIAY